MIIHTRLEDDALPHFVRRILPVTLSISLFYSDLMAGARVYGKAIGKSDGFIAATAAERGLIVATRDTSPFKAAGLKVINP